MQKGVLGVVCGMAISGAINCLILSFASRHDIAFSLLPLEIKKLLRYGLPLIFTNIAGILMNLSDRFFIKYYTGLGEVGIYNLGYQIGSVILVVLVSPFKLIWPATLLSVRHDKDAGEFYSRVMTYFVYAGLFLSLAVGVFATKIVELVGTREYLEAYRVIFIISLSYLLIGMSDVMHVGISIKRKTEYSMLIVSSAALVNLILNFLLVPPWGMMGAAMATILATIFMVYIKQIVVKKIYYIKYEWNRIFTMAAVAVGLYWTISMLGTEDIWYEIPLKLVFVTLFPVILYLSGFYQKIEVETLRSFVKKLFL
ncbi:MAG: polysaccharide biosynthesis C-terminal domain-containing protein [Nitrospinota bacterium]